jgi:signal transduction histidine kinase/CheY-like chemotaxis protein
MLVSAFAIAVGVAGAIWYATAIWVQREERSATTIALARANLGAEAMEQHVLRVVDQVEGLLDLMASRQRSQEAGDQAAQLALEVQIVAQLRRREGEFNQVSLAGLDGFIRWSGYPSNSPTPIYIGDREYYRVPRAGLPDLFISEQLQSRFNARWTIVFSRALRDRAGDIVGVAFVSVDAFTLSRRMTEVGIGANGIALLLRRDGTVLAHSRDELAGRAQRVQPAHPIFGAIRLSRGGQLEVANPEDGRPELIGYRALGRAPLVVVVALDATRELAAVHGLRTAAFLAASVITLLTAAGLMLGVLFAERWRTRAALDAARAEREAALESLAQGQRMEALGRLAGGVAHDINNVLQAVLGGSRLIVKRSQDHGVHRLAQLVSEAAERGGAVTRRLLAFARRDSLEAEPLAVQPLLEGVREVLVHTLGAAVHVRLRIAPGAPALLADRAQLETVLVNLAINARDAMMPLGGTLEIGAVADIISPRSAARLRPGAYVRLSVSDTGCGMDPETLRRATEPFFTTKEKGQGTGLGLAMAQGFCEQSGGMLDIRSVVGQGTRVTLWLPQAPAASSVLQPVGARSQAAERRCHVMLVDDEPEVLAVLAAGLRERGHSVVAAGGGLEALGAMAADPSIELLVTDLSMPGIDGLKLIEEVRRLRPGLPAVLVTGFVAEAEDVLEQAAEAGPMAVLRKPVTAEVLSARISALVVPQKLAV